MGRAVEDATMSTTTAPPPGLSTWERGVYQRLAQHLEDEAPLIAAYTRLAEESDSDYVRYIVDMILEDEARHHRMLQELLRSLTLMVAPHESGEGVPHLGRVEHAGELLEVTDRLIDFERDDKRSLRRLRRELHDVRDTSLWDLVVDAMQRDTDKHLAILGFLRERLATAR
jgi:rubrerythrin